MTAERQNWNDKPDDAHEAFQNYKNALYDAMIYAERYSRALNHTKTENNEQALNVRARAASIEMAEAIIRQLYTSIR